MQEELCPDCGRMHRLNVLHQIEVAETLTTATGLRCTGIDAQGVTAVDGEGRESKFPADTVVMCVKHAAPFRRGGAAEQVLRRVLRLRRRRPGPPDRPGHPGRL